MSLPTQPISSQPVPSEDTPQVNVTFYDSYVPSIKAGTYTLTAAQALTSDNPNVPGTPEPPVSQKFIVRGPRFGILPADLHRAFPPPESTGVWSHFLPMAVFNKRALPWEQPLELSVPNPEALPWMALLVFTQEELDSPLGVPSLDDPSPPPPNSQANPTRSIPLLLNDAVHAVWKGQPTKGPPPPLVGPTIKLDDDEDPNEIQVNAIDVPAQMFADLIPTAKDLAFLAHVREVSTENKEPQNSLHDGWYSVLIGNRFAIPPQNGPQRINVVHLVSLEGLEQYIGVDTPITPPGPVRLISLYSWAFRALPVPLENFRELMLNLISDASAQGTNLLLRLPIQNAATAATAAEKSALERLDRGYIPLSYGTLTGETTFAWYRGPLTAAPAKPFLDIPSSTPPADAAAPFNTAEAMIYDPASGLFDQSYAVAFQTGRSLALADLPFATALSQWRREAHAVVDQVMEYSRSPHLRGILRGLGIVASNDIANASASDLSKLLDRRLVSNAFRSYLATEFGKSVAKRVGRSAVPEPIEANRAMLNRRPPAPPTPSDLAELTQRPGVVSLLRQISGLEPAEPGSRRLEENILPEYVIEWLEQTALLYSVPFSNLVPSARMLPEESIRFFYVDNNWVAALLDGALSIGIQSSRDALLQKLVREPLHRQVKSRIHQVRQRLRKVRVTAATASEAKAVCGFVLRSAVVSGWPGLEVRAFSDQARTNLIMPLRLDRVSPSVMIALYAEIPAVLEFNEPSEGLVFGREDQGVSLRYVPGTQGATQSNIGHLLQPPVWLPPAELDAVRRPQPAGSGALRIAGPQGLVEALQAKFPGTAPTLSPASLAVEMVTVPEQMLFLPVMQNGAH